MIATSWFAQERKSFWRFQLVFESVTVQLPDCTPFWFLACYSYYKKHKSGISLWYIQWRNTSMGKYCIGGCVVGFYFRCFKLLTIGVRANKFLGLGRIFARFPPNLPETFLYHFCLHIFSQRSWRPFFDITSNKKFWYDIQKTKKFWHDL